MKALSNVRANPRALAYLRLVMGMLQITWSRHVTCPFAVHRLHHTFASGSRLTLATR